jgi:hypothetical protein
MDGDGNCVEFLSGTNNWASAKVRSLTPGMLETEVPGSIFGCLGNSGERIRVSKKLGAVERIDDVAFCTNVEPL